MKARPNTFVTYTFGAFNGNTEVWIHCRPQQKWDYQDTIGKVVLRWKNMSMVLPKKEFEKHWKVIEE